MTMIEKTIVAATHGRYLVEAPPGVGPWPLLVGFHGYAEGAEAQFDRLRLIDGADRWVIAAVQGLHRFYRRRTNEAPAAMPARHAHSSIAGEGISDPSTGSGSSRAKSRDERGWGPASQENAARASGVGVGPHAKKEEVVASWMTRQDRELAIADNLIYVSSVVEAISREWDATGPLVFAGFSQGVAMAFRAATASPRWVSGVVANGSDVPPELDRAALQRIPAVLLGRGIRDEWYTREKLGDDERRLRGAGVHVDTLEMDCGHDWPQEFSKAAGTFLEVVSRPRDSRHNSRAGHPV